MIYLESFSFPSWEAEELALYGTGKNKDFGLVGAMKRQLGGDFKTENLYPFKVLHQKEISSLDFAPITIFYGGNGSGKSTILNLIAHKLKIQRKTPYNRTDFLEYYSELCDFQVDMTWLEENFDLVKEKETAKNELFKITKILTSDDVFQSMLENRQKNKEIATKTQSKISEFLSQRKIPKRINFQTNEGIDELEQYAKVKKMSANDYLSQKLGKVEKRFSNGETALMALFQQITDNGLYLLDEPENSMSCQFQLQLAEFLELTARSGSQLIIATHSPFLLAMEGAKIYDLDAQPVQIKSWHELENMKIYFEFFKQFEGIF